MLKKSSILVTGGTGSFGQTFIPMTLDKYDPERIVVFSRDEMKQWEMAKKYKDDPRVRFLIGDVRDKDRLYRALDGIDYVVHAAATKIVPTAEYDPFECVKTNVFGAMNIIDACIDILAFVAAIYSSRIVRKLLRPLIPLNDSLNPKATKIISAFANTKC